MTGIRDDRLTVRFLAPKRVRLHSPACDVAQLSLLVTMRHGPTKNRFCAVTSILVRVAALDLRDVNLAIPNLPACCLWIFTDNLVCFGLFLKGGHGKRERGEGGLIKIRGCRFSYAQFYTDGRQIRVSTRTEVKEKAKKELRRLMGDTQSGDLYRKTRYGEFATPISGRRSYKTTLSGGISLCRRPQTGRRRSGV